MSHTDTAHELHAAGISVVPVATDGSKRPAVAWKQYTQARATTDELNAWFRGDAGVGMITGKISGNVEMLELEGRAAHHLTHLTALAEASGLTELWRRINTGWLELSPSGGVHWLYRLSDAPVPGNTKLAADTEKVTLAETRGEGGFVILAPTAGTAHPTGKAWQRLAGGPATIPTLTTSERDALHLLVRTIDETPEQQPTPPTPTSTLWSNYRPLEGDITPGDDYENRTDWAEILTPHGWTLVYQRGNLRYWCRPGKKDGISATTGKADDRDRLYVFTSSTDFQPETPYTKFGAYALLKHHSNHTAAAKQLAADGYGHRAPRELTPARQPAPTRHLTAVPNPETTGTNPAPHPTTIIDSDPANLTDAGNARLLAAEYSARLRYVPDAGRWVQWTGTRWEWAADDAPAIQAALDIADRLPTDNEQIRKHRIKSLGTRQLTNVVRLARTLPELRTPASDFDTHAWQLNTPKGVIDLKTGNITTPTPHLYHSKQTTVHADLDTVPELWGRFLATTFGGDQPMIDYVQRLAGISLIGQVIEHVLPFLHGAGGNGKALDINTPILTNKGWTRMGDLETGMQVYGTNGKLTKITYTSPIMRGHRVYKVTTKTGRTLIADHNHLWTVTDNGTLKTVTTADMIKRGLTTQTRPAPNLHSNKNGLREWRYRLPAQPTLEGSKENLPIDPYLLGYWLGNGTSRAAAVTAHTTDIDHVRTEAARAGINTSLRDIKNGRECATVSLLGTVQTALRNLNLLRNKHIPETYQHSSIKQRLELLQGLLDSDGSITKTQDQVEFTTTHEQLAKDTLLLLRTLGWLPTIQEDRAQLNDNNASPRWRITFTPSPTDPNPFKLHRKAIRVKAPHGSSHTDAIVNITEIPTRPVRCIQVNSNDHLYLAGQDLIPTHNTVFLETITTLLGDYATEAPHGFLLAGRDRHETELASLQGRRFVVAAEINEGTKFDEAKVKTLTGGDKITARFMRQDFFTFNPTHTLWLMGNNQPKVESGGNSFWRRLRLIPFTRIIPEHERIENLQQRLVNEEGPAILAWLITGAVLYHRHGLNEPNSVKTATKTYQHEEDHLARFIEDTCIIGGGDHARIDTAELRRIYDTWCRNENENELNGTAFGRQLKQKFDVGSIRTKGRKFYTGIMLQHHDESNEPNNDGSLFGNHWSDR